MVLERQHAQMSKWSSEELQQLSTETFRHQDLSAPTKT